MTDRPGDPADRVTDAAADGAFGGHARGPANRRSGYSTDIEFEGVTYTKLEWIMRQARQNGTLASGEGKMLVEEIDRLRIELAKARTAMTHVVAMHHPGSRGLRHGVCKACDYKYPCPTVRAIKQLAAIDAARGEG